VLEPTAAGNAWVPVAPGETTVVHKPLTRRRAMWAIPALAVLLLAIVGGFFAYQSRRSSAEVSAPVTESQPSPTVEISPSPEASEDAEASAETELDKEAEKEAEKAAEKEQKRQEQAAKREAAKRAEDQAARREPDEARQQQEAVHPNVPDPPDINPKVNPNIDPPDVPRTGSVETKVTANGMVIRRFADGTQIVTFPDGRRVLVKPDGTRVLLRPAQRPFRRRP
ncbi:MAG TPA: T-complex 10 C-terminal domain-containing protein, partial [Pyrinomonadaceae bacterium]|nr:T-complex 10 C-terminal domain-containing protein [Pyrinomonadaceae bacterium]